MTGRFGTVVTAMATPFDEGGALDVDGAVALARWLCDHGSDGLVVAGTTGESPTLTDDEKLELWRAVGEAVTVPMIVGSVTNDTGHSVELTRRVAGLGGVAGVLALVPYYNRPSQAGIAAHVEACAEAAGDLPVMVYDVPARTGRKVEHATLLRLAHDVPNVLAVKDAAGDVAGTARLVAEAPSAFEVYSGDDKLLLGQLAVGAVGVVGVATHWAGREVAEMITAFQKGDVERARQLNARLIPSWDLETSDEAPNPVPTKAVLRVLGLPAGACRPPMGPEPAGLEARARAVLAGLR